MRRIEGQVALALRSLKAAAESKGADLDDMAQEGRIAGWKADAAWKEGGTSWVTYVGRRVYDAMLRTMKGKSGVVRTPRTEAAVEGWIEFSAQTRDPHGRDEDVEACMATDIDNERRISAALDQLESQERELVLEHYALGKSQQELAAEQNKPKITIFRELDRVRKSWAVPEAVVPTCPPQLELYVAQRTGPPG